jgi:hypothetical protein
VSVRTNGRRTPYAVVRDANEGRTAPAAAAPNRHDLSVSTLHEGQHPGVDDAASPRYAKAFSAPNSAKNSAMKANQNAMRRPRIS